MKYELKVQYMYELGSRSNQEDSLYPLPAELSDNARCFVLCDGMGGHDSGEVASDAVCRAMGAYADACNRGDLPFTADNLREALNAAYDALDERDTHAAKKMGTTMTFLAFHAGGCLVAHIGDSRVYHLRPGQGILFETRDHSLVNDLIKVGELTEETAKDFPQKNVITRVMQPNQERRSRADIKEITDVRPGDYFFMCSDGVNETMESRNIANVLLNGTQSDADKMRIIKDVTSSSHDNHTAFLIRVERVDGEVKLCGKPISVGGGERVQSRENVKNNNNGNLTTSRSLNKKMVSIVSLILLCVVAAIFLLKPTSKTVNATAHKQATEQPATGQPKAVSVEVVESAEPSVDEDDVLSSEKTNVTAEVEEVSSGEEPINNASTEVEDYWFINNSKVNTPVKVEGASSNVDTDAIPSTQMDSASSSDESGTNTPVEVQETSPVKESVVITPVKESEEHVNVAVKTNDVAVDESLQKIMNAINVQK